MSDYEGRTPTFYSVYYSDPIADLLSGSSPVLPAVWRHIQSTYGSKKSSSKSVPPHSGVSLPLCAAGTTEIRAFVLFAINTKSLVSSSDTMTVASILLNSDDSSKAFDPSIVAATINYDDFTELVCRLIMSPLWVYGQESAAPVGETEAPAPDPLDENVNSSNAAVEEVAQTEPTKEEYTRSMTDLLTQRLSHFLTNFDVTALGQDS